MPLLEIGLQVDPSRITPLTQKLAEWGYLEEPISKLLGRWDVSEMVAKEYPNYIWRCKTEGSDLAQLVGIFLLGQATDRETMVRFLGSELAEALKECGVLLEYKGQWASHAVIYPCMGRTILTDHWIGHGVQTPGKVYELGTDSYVLARVTPRRNVRRALDLCTGSGVHAVMSAKTAETSIAVDINSRAIEYTTLNAALNGVRVTTHLGDLYSPVAGETFDLITANPPFVPSPDPNVLIHRSAGETGEEVPERLVAGLKDHLAPGGLFSMVLDHPVFADDPYLERLERWLGETRGWGIALLTFHELALPAYIMDHLQGVEDYERTFEDYLESYSRMGIKSVEFANVFIVRTNTEAPNWKVEARCNWPNIDITPQIAEWLDCLTLYHAPEMNLDPACRPSLSANYVALWRDWTHSRGILETSPTCWLASNPLNGEEARLMQLMQGGERTLEEIRLEFGDDQAFWPALRGLGKQRALQGIRQL